MTTDVVVFTGVTKRYGDVVAVDDVSLRIGRGDIYGLLGLNGAGKTTLIRVLLGMVRPTAGVVSLFGEPVGPRTRRVWARVGHLVEAPSAYPELTVVENLSLQARMQGLGSAPAAIRDVVDTLALGPYAGRRAGTLSLGNKQRLGLAKALLHRPELLVLDEPGNGLDPAGVVEIRELVKGLGVTVLLSSHALGEVARVASRIGIIHDGRLRRELDQAALAAATRPRLSVSARNNSGAAAVLRTAGYRPLDDDDGLVLGDPEAVAAPETVAALLCAAGHPPTRLVVRRDDLETVFLRAVGSGVGDA